MSRYIQHCDDFLTVIVGPEMSKVLRDWFDIGAKGVTASTGRG